MSGAGFTFDGASVTAREGQSLAAALTEAGIRRFRETAKGADRSIFCGMGVCQDCLVTVNGVPNRRACMTAAEPGLKVETQVPFPRLQDLAAPAPQVAARTISPDVLILGGGAAGLSAAIAARRAGASVVVLDERKVGGGQYFKQSASGAPLDAQQQRGAALLQATRESGAELLGQVEIWGAFDGPLLLAEHHGAALIARPKTVIVATGAYERPVMVPGWTLPGVMTSGAAQTLWRSYRTLPGKRVAIAGSGPLNLQVADELLRGGAKVTLVAEAGPAPWRHPLRAMALALAGPGLAMNGLGMIARLRRGGVRISYGTSLSRVDAKAGGLLVSLSNGDQTEVDCLLMNAGFEPQNELLRLLGAAMDYDPAAGHLRCRRDADCATSVPGVFAVGDCAGLGGAPAAMVEGRIAGRAAAALAGFGDAHDGFADQRALTRHRRFQRRLWALHDIIPGTPAALPDETIICRCEEITLGQIRAGMDSHPAHAGTLKRATRMGMGRCQGRYCGPVAARLVAADQDQPLGDRSYFAPRVPVKPVAISVILAAEEAMRNDP